MDFKQTALGLEFGSTRIKAVLIDKENKPIAQGSHEWENQYVNGVWTYSMDAIIGGLQSCFADLKKDVKEKFGVTLTEVGAMGISGMMHGYLPLGKDNQPLAEFRTWRNTITSPAAAELTELFHFNIPQRWSIAHLYQAILNGEEHLPRLCILTTLAGYIHLRLTGKNVLGIGEASGVFPIDSAKPVYDAAMLDKFDALTAPKGFPWKIRDVLPALLMAGENAGYLTEDGAKLLDPAGDLKPGIPFCPPEGDAGTGMTATNSVAARTGNVSAGTSDFAMIVVDHGLGVHREIDMVTTPAGLPVAMVHCNNCTSDINAWVNLFAEFAGLIGAEVNKGDLYVKLFQKALEGDKDCGGLLSFNYFSGEGVTDLDEGRPVFARMENAKMNLANFMRTHLLSALATLKIGLDILTKEENVPIDKLYGHGGYFKTPGVGQRMMSAAVGSPVSVMETAGEGGPYGMALLAGYMMWKKDGQPLEDYLNTVVFKDAKASTLMADEADIQGFQQFLARYQKALDMEKAAIRCL
jgi:sugar (pentulose or hexulose) kinase